MPAGRSSFPSCDAVVPPQAGPTRWARGPFWLLAAVAAAGVVFGCSANVVAESSAGSGARIAVLDVRVQQGGGSVDAAARFVSVEGAGTATEALDLLGLSWGSLPAGACVREDSIPEPHRAKAPLRVDLRDLSPVQIAMRTQAGTSRTIPLEPRAFPDVVGLVSGVVFVSPPPAAGDDEPTPSTWQGVDMTVGGVTLGGLELPELPAKLRLIDATEQHVPADSTSPRDISYVLGHSWLDIEAPAEHVERRPVADRLSIDVVRAGATRARCGLDAQGRTRIDPRALGGAGEVTLLVRAQRRITRDEASLGALEGRLEKYFELKVVAK